MEQIDIKNGASSSCVLELVCLKAKEEEEGNLTLAGSVCRQQFVGVTVAVGVLDVKSLIEHDGEGWKSWKCTIFKM